MNIKILRNLRRALMKGLVVVVLGMIGNNSWGQTTYDWFDTAPDGNWKQGASGARWTGGLWDEPPFGIIRFNNNHQLTMTNNVSGTYSQHQIIFGSSNTSNRSISGNTVRFYDFSTADPKIENQSIGQHTISFNIEGDGDLADPLELNPINGNLVFGGTIDNKGSAINIYGNNSKTITFNGVISGSGVFSLLQNSTAILTGLNTFTGVTTVTNGTLQLSKLGGTTIPITNNITINGGTLQISSNQTLNDLTISSGGLTIDDGVTLTINGTLTYSGGTINYGSTPTGNLVISNSGKLMVSSGTFTTSGRLTLKSDATGTASIGNSAGSISGNVAVERYISGSGRRWRFLSSPVQSATIANWMSQFYVTGPGDGTTLGAALPVTGWHTSQANISFPNSTFGSDPRSVKNTSIRTYDETVSGNNTNLNSGWSNLSGTSQALTPGQGFRTYIRGPIGNTNQLDGSVSSQSTVTLTLSGTVNQGNVTPTLTNSTQGWNLLGNPYPCAYDFNSQYDANQGIANISPTVYVYDATSNGYVSYNASSNTASGLTSGVIPSGAGFFVQATGVPTFQFREAYKTTAVNPTAVHKTEISTVDFGIKYYKDSTESDFMVIKMLEGATMNNEIFDTKKVYNENLNLSTYGTDSVLLTASCIPFVSNETRVKLNVEATQIGSYHFDFKNMDNFDAGVSVHLFDRYTNTTTDVRANTQYTFDMGAGENQWGKNRFELILNKITTGIENISNSIASTNLIVFPNPATDLLNISLSNSNFKNSTIIIYNVSGMEVSKSTMNGSTAQLNIESLSTGVYFVKVSNENGFSKTVKFVK